MMAHVRLFLVIGAVFITCLFLFDGTSPKISVMSSSSGSPEPQCRCELHGAVYDFCYHLPPVPEIQGRKFNCVHAQYLEELGLLSTEAALDPKRDELPEPVFVTATSDNHFREALTLLANIRKLWPQKNIIVYNIGLNPKTIQALKAKCLVEVRDFPFSFYPPYVKQLDQYRWKPLLIAMMVKEFGAVWYMDTSIRWKTDRLNQVYDEIRCRKDHGWSDSRNFLKDPNVTECGKSAYLLHSSSGHGVFSTTHPGVYEYIPTLLPFLKERTAVNHDAGFAFVVRTKDAINILKWYVLCALEKHCMEPPGAKLACSFKDPFRDYAGCHRYDQSVINLLLANSFGYNSKNYVSILGPEGATVNRSTSSLLTPKDFLCNNTA